MRIGFCWAGSASYHRDFARSTVLAQWWPLLRLPGIEWIALIAGDRTADLETKAGGGVPHVTLPPLPDWSATADHLRTLDLVITVDTALAHVAGDANIPTWVLLPTPNDWRWLEDRTDSPWYPSVTLYRQTHAGDWWDVLARVHVDLQALLLRRAA